jgi:hypothetical protein
VSAAKPHITETEAYWRALAATERHFARAERRRRCGQVESIRRYEAQAAEYDREADRLAAIAKATGGAAA